MSDPEPDELFRARLLRVVADNERHLVGMAYGAHLDNIGRQVQSVQNRRAAQGIEPRTGLHLTLFRLTGHCGGCVSHFPTSHQIDRTSPQLKAETRESTYLEVRGEMEVERRDIDERTARLRAMRLARKKSAS